MTRSAVLSSLGALVAALLVWKAVVLLGGLPPFILPPPEAVAARLLEAIGEGTLAPHLGATVVEVVLGFVVGATLAVVGAIVGEWAGAERGLGVLVNLARGSLFDIPLMFAALVTIAALGIVLYVLVVLAERRLVGAR